MEDSVTIEKLVDLFNDKLTKSNALLEEFKAEAFRYKQLYEEEKENAKYYSRLYHELNPLDDYNKTEFHNEDGDLVGILFGKGPNILDILEVYKERDELLNKVKELKMAFS
jgi:hypothetical protein